MMTGRDLAKLFDDFNARAWAGRLPRYHLRRTRAFVGCQQGICKTKTRTIDIDTLLILVRSERPNVRGSTADTSNRASGANVP